MNATRAQRWNDISYVFLGPYGDRYARAYYIDYPLLYLNVHHWPDAVVPGVSPLAYYEEVSVPTTGKAFYAAQCTGQTDLLVDNRLTKVSCNGVQGLSGAFLAWGIGDPDPAVDSFKVFKLRRYVF
jgi:hypothetical protein